MNAFKTIEGGRAITIADLCDFTPEGKARENYQRHIEDQYMWELEREERQRELKAVGRIAIAFLSAAIMVTALVAGVIAIGYFIGA